MSGDGDYFWTRLETGPAANGCGTVCVAFEDGVNEVVEVGLDVKCTSKDRIVVSCGEGSPAETYFVVGVADLCAPVCSAWLICDSMCEGV